MWYTHGTSTIREECTAYGSTERVAELFKRLLQKIFAQSRSATKRETSEDEASGTLSTVPTNNCQHRKTLFYMYIVVSAWLSTRLGSARLASSHHIASRLDSFSFVLFRIDLRLVDDSCAMTEIEIVPRLWGWKWGWGRVSRIC